jgi:hypothetical protein
LLDIGLLRRTARVPVLFLPVSSRTSARKETAAEALARSRRALGRLARARQFVRGSPPAQLIRTRSWCGGQEPWRLPRSLCCCPPLSPWRLSRAAKEFGHGDRMDHENCCFEQRYEHVHTGSHSFGRESGLNTLHTGHEVSRTDESFVSSKPLGRTHQQQPPYR